MASGLFFDPFVALRALPLVSSTCTLLYARDQHFFFGTLRRPELRTKTRPLVSPHFYRGLTFVVGVLGVTTWSLVANLHVHRPALQALQSFRWYVASAVLSASHLLFVPWIANSCKNLVHADPDCEGEDSD